MGITSNRSTVVQDRVAGELTDLAYAVALRLAAVQALGKMNLPETWIILQRLSEEKNTPLQEILQKLIQTRRSA